MDYEGLPGVLLDKISIPIWSDFNEYKDEDKKLMS